jgi:hypothetical protein
VKQSHLCAGNKFFPRHKVTSPHTRAQEAVTFARDRSFEREAVVDERILMRDALRRGMGEVRYPEVWANYQVWLSTGEFQEVRATKHASGPRITSDRAIAAEKEVLRAINANRRFVDPILPIQRAIAFTEAHPVLNPSQRRAVEAVLTSRDQIQGIQGYAGTGKTTTLTAIREVAEREGYAVRGLAPTLKATSQLREAGISSTTIQSHLARNEHIPADPTGKRLFVLDESSLASTVQMRDFLARLRSLDRALLVGDIRQHEAIEAGRPFAQLQQAGMSTAKLDQIVRQKDPQLRAAVEHLPKGEIASAVRMLSEQGRITQIRDRSGRLQAIARRYAKTPSAQSSSPPTTPPGATSTEPSRVNCRSRESLRRRAILLLCSSRGRT